MLLLATGCLGSGGPGETNAAPTGSIATTTLLTTPTVTEPVTLTHRHFVRRLDGLCRKFNKKLDRKFGAAEDAAIAANDYGRLADLMKRSNRLDRPFYRAVKRLGSQVPDRDARGLRRYLTFSHELDNFGNRYIRALRHSDENELGRLNVLIEHTRNQRTRVTARMGLKRCGS